MRLPARVHGRWTTAWWGGDPALAAIFGPAPSHASLEAAAERTAAAAPDGWRQALIAGTPPPPADALVVLAGQQPVLAGGPLLVAHKAATAIALARILAERWGRPVVPVFLLADEDHDTGEVDHIDLINPSSGRLNRVRVPITPRHEAFFRARWDADRLAHVLRTLTNSCMPLDGLPGDGAVPDHVAGLLARVFGPAGLHLVLAHTVSSRGRAELGRALSDPVPLREALARGADALGQADLPVSFDAADPRPLVLESRGGRRRRVPVDDREAATRFTNHPGDFSPQAALRPVVQAAALPVVAQVVGPSELLYLGQARGLHALFDLPAPVLVPRLEGTVVGADFRPEDLDAQGETTSRLAERARAVAAAAQDLADLATAQAPGLAARARRWIAVVEQGAERLAGAPAWHGGGDAARHAVLHPRGRPQDTVLPWLPEAVRSGEPAAWAERLVSLCRPLAPPAHVAYTLGTPPGAESPHA